MDPVAPLNMIERFEIISAMHNAGVDLMEQNLMRKFPLAPRAEIVHRLRAWLGDRSPQSDEWNDFVPCRRLGKTA